MLTVLAQALPGTPVQTLVEKIAQAIPGAAGNPVASLVGWAITAGLVLATIIFATRTGQRESFSQSMFLALASVASAGILAFAALGIEWIVPLAIAAFVFAWASWIYYLPRNDTLPWALILVGVGVAAGFAVMGAGVGAFFLAAGVSLFGAAKVVSSKEVMHAVVWLAAALVGVAGLFLTTGAEFLAAIQVLVYVGAVITLFLFTVMLTIPAQESHFLDEIHVPAGITIENVQDLEEVHPNRGQGPMKGSDHPRRPVRQPTTLYGVSLADAEFGHEDSPVKKGATPEPKPKKEGA